MVWKLDGDIYTQASVTDTDSLLHSLCTNAIRTSNLNKNAATEQLTNSAKSPTQS